MDPFTVAWILWALSFLVIEGIALYTGHGTLSAHVWSLQQYPVVRAPLMALLVWLTFWHFGVERLLPESVRKTHADDGLLAGAVTAFTLLVSKLARK